MKKGLYIAFHDVDPAAGVSQKILNQVKSFNYNGVEMSLLSYRKKDGVRTAYIDDDEIAPIYSGIECIIHEIRLYPKLLEYIDNNNVKLLFIRYTQRLDYYYIQFLKKCKKRGCTILLEIPTYPYDISSMNCAVELIKSYHGLFSLKTFFFRLPTIYSWNSKPYYENGVETKKAWRILIDQATKGEDIHVWGDPNRPKDMVYVKDLCQEFYKACFVDRDYGFYNIGTGVGTTLLDQIKGMIEVFGEGKKSKILFSPEKRNAPQYIMNIDEAREELGYEPKYLYLDMLRDMKKERDLGRF